MRVFDLVGGTHGQQSGTRVGVIGSCRVHDPFETLADAGRAVRVWANPSSATHTFGEALQITRFTRGECDIPQVLRPLIFHPPEIAERTPVDKRILDSVDAVFVEISELRHISCESYYFQGNFFYREFVSKYGGPLLPWYRAFSLGQPIRDEIVLEAMQKLADRSADERVMIEKILRGTQLKIPDVDTVAAMLDGIMFDRTKRWILVSHFIVPELGGTQMKDRAKLIDVVRQAAARLGAAMFDPTVIIEERGRVAALASEGRDIYHYNRDIYEDVADSLLKAGGLLTDQQVSPVDTAPIEPRKSSAAAATEWVNETLIQVHTKRLTTLGVDESGLYAHYKGLLDNRQIAGSTIAGLANLIASLLPRFDHYHVLRAGLGEIAFVLAALGLRAVGYDQNSRRFSAMYAGLEKFANDDLDMARRLTIGQVAIPDVPEQGRTFAIAHHLIGFKPEQQSEVMAQLSAYDALLIDPRIFLYTRQTDQEKDAVLETVRAAGFTQIREFPRLGVVYCSKPVTLGTRPRGQRVNLQMEEGVGTRATSKVEKRTAPVAAAAAEPVIEEPEVRSWMLAGPFTSDGGGAWVRPVPDELRDRTDNNEEPYRSHLRLLENDLELGPGHARHESIRTLGQGHYSLWSGMLYFSTSDGSDPNTNSRSYTLMLVD